MKTIHTLPPALVAKIAAGEVIERPAFVVKELLDNAIDAQATDIRIEIVDHGTEQIVVTDNGKGMSPEDLADCYRLHTTSKVAPDAETLQVTTLGFRGEALASIAAVATLTIESKPSTAIAGTKITISASGTTTERLGMPTGTRVAVSSLFEHLPVRKKALQQKKREYKRIMDIVLTYMLGYPEIYMSVSHNGTSVLTTKPATQEQRIVQLLGEEIFSQIFPIHCEVPYITANGYIASPQLPEHYSFQYVYLNGRPVTDDSIKQAVRSAYESMLATSVCPSYILFLRCPPEWIDVNIHPRKETVQVADETHLFTTIQTAVTAALHSQNIVFETTTSQLHDRNDGFTYTTLATQLKQTVLPKKTLHLTGRIHKHSLIQIHNLFILAETDEGLLCIDQHAAHERILYEEFKKAFLSEQYQQQQYRLPQPIPLTIASVHRFQFEAYMPDLEAIGFVFQQNNPEAYLLTHLPQIFSQRNAPILLHELITELDTHTFLPGIDSGSKRMLAFLACRSAVKAGDPLTETQMRSIVDALELMPQALTCPHGRPLRVVISKQQLQSMFKRT